MEVKKENKGRLLMIAGACFLIAGFSYIFQKIIGLTSYFSYNIFFHYNIWKRVLIIINNISPIGILYISWGLKLFFDGKNFKKLWILLLLILLYIANGFEVVFIFMRNSGNLFEIGLYFEMLSIFFLVFSINRKHMGEVFSKFTCWIAPISCIVLGTIILFTCFAVVGASLMSGTHYVSNNFYMEATLYIIRTSTTLLGLFFVSIWEVFQCMISQKNKKIVSNKRIITKWCAPMNCDNCRAEVIMGAKFCDSCGMPIKYVPITKMKTVITARNIESGIRVIFLLGVIIAFLAIDVFLYRLLLS